MTPKSNAKSLDGIRTRKQNRNLNHIEKKHTISVDTETENGDIFLVADSNGNYLDDITLDNILKYLLSMEGKWIFFYNLSYDAECILKLLPKEILMQYKYRHVLKFKYKKYKIHYFDGKKLSISKGKHSVSCYDIAQYYDRKPLAVAYTESIKKKLDSNYLKLKKKREIFSKFYYSRHKKEIRAYCIEDCRLTNELADNWIDTFEQVFGFYPNNWISAGYLAEKVLINNNISIPLFNEIPYSVQEIARSSFYGGRFELIKRGFIGECYLYDINSAYPYALTNLLEIRDGRWFESTKIHPKAKIGFFFIEANVSNKVKIAPFPFVKKNKTICYPSGKFRTFVTLDELQMVKDDPEIKYKIIESWQFIPKNNSYPFKKFIEEQYYQRLKLKQKNNPLEKAIKIVLNSIYGKMAQRTNNVIGNLFNPVIASYITGFTRRQLYEFTKKNKLDNFVVAYATDSIACQKKIENLDSMKLGEMKLDKYADDVIFLSNGFYRFNGIWKQRGIGYDHAKKIEIEHLDTKVSKDGQLYISVKSTRTTHIKSGILFNRLKNVGKIVPYEKKMNLNSDKKRFWLDSLESLNDGKMCDSMPIPIDLVGQIISKEDLEWYEDEKYEPESDL